ncbi:MAG TPA: RluA family pseudouridine synthase [Candidatus Scybalocola faecipullorum]|nr:RluA family pseudouridine synthase [Candidatus Scybalocola faecipullorum]
MTEHLEFIVDENHTGERIDKYLSAVMPGQSRSYIQKLIKDASVFADLKPVKSSYKVILGEHIQVAVPEPVSLDIRPENIPLDIIYEDQDVILINKPKDMVVHPSAGHESHTLVNALLYHCKDQLSTINGVLRPGIVHRIDKDTTGVIVICKNDMAHQSLADQLKVHSITRKYEAIVYGNFSQDGGTVEAPIGRSPHDRKKMAVNYKNGRSAVTHYRVLERFGKYTYIECTLETGRTHQIRVHMSNIGHPLLGDEVYGPSKCPFSLQGQTLHARILGFVHPRTGEYMEFEAPLPEYFNKLLKKLRG